VTEGDKVESTQISATPQTLCQDRLGFNLLRTSLAVFQCSQHSGVLISFADHSAKIRFYAVQITDLRRYAKKDLCRGLPAGISCVSPLSNHIWSANYVRSMRERLVPKDEFNCETDVGLF
jgi:hypothetical protein